MSYLDLINAFERWLETNYLPSSAQLLWYKLIHIFNRAGWCEWVTVDNQRLMSVMQMESEKTLIRCRDKLIDSKLIEYQKGKKGSPNKYKILTVNFTGNMTVEMTVQMGVKTTANVSNIKDKDKDIYINLLNKYKKQFKKCTSWFEKLKLQKALAEEIEYQNLTNEKQNNMIKELMGR